MFYNYAELEDGTQVAFSNVLDGGEVQVSIERPVDLGFDSAMCTLPAFEWSEIEASMRPTSLVSTPLSTTTRS